MLNNPSEVEQYCRAHPMQFSVRESKKDHQQKGQKGHKGHKGQHGKKGKKNKQRRNSKNSKNKTVTVGIAKQRKKPSWSRKWLSSMTEGEGEEDKTLVSGPPVPIRTVLAAAGEDAEEEEEDDSELKITTPQEQQRHEMAQTILMIFSGSGWDVRLVMHALKACNDDGDLATEWLYVKVLVVHVGGTRRVPSSTDHTMNRQARITWTVACIRTCIFFMFL